MAGTHEDGKCKIDHNQDFDSLHYIKHYVRKEMLLASRKIDKSQWKNAYFV